MLKAAVRKTEHRHYLLWRQEKVRMGLDFVRNLVQNMSFTGFLSQAWPDDRGQDIAEYSVILAVVVLVVVGAITALVLKLSDAQ